MTCPKHHTTQLRKSALSVPFLDVKHILVLPISLYLLAMSRDDTRALLPELPAT